MSRAPLGVSTPATKHVQAASQSQRDQTRAGVLFVFGSMLFLLLTTASEAIYPNFSLQTNAISDLAAVGAPTTLIEETAIIGLGVCWLLGVYYLFRSSGKRGSMTLYMLPGVGFLLAGFSPENVNVVIHSSGAPLAFVLGGIVAILSYKIIRSPFRYFAAALGGLTLVSTFIIFVGGQIIGPCSTCYGTAPPYVQSLQRLGLGLGGQVLRRSLSSIASLSASFRHSRLNCVAMFQVHGFALEC